MDDGWTRLVGGPANGEEVDVDGKPQRLRLPVKAKPGAVRGAVAVYILEGGVYVFKEMER